MTRRVHPLTRRGREFALRKARVGVHDQVDERFLAAGGNGLKLAFADFPVRGFGGKVGVTLQLLACPIHGKQQLKVGGLFCPQGAIVIEHRNAVFRCDIVIAAGGGGAFHEGDQGAAYGRVAPRRQCFVGICYGQEQARQQTEYTHYLSSDCASRIPPCGSPFGCNSHHFVLYPHTGRSLITTLHQEYGDLVPCIHHVETACRSPFDLSA